MTDPQEASDNAKDLAHSDGSPGTSQTGPADGHGVGGPTATMESSTEDALSGSDDPTIGDVPATGDQAANPL